MSYFEDDPRYTNAQISAMDGRDEARSIDAIALTVISACIGVRAADMPADGSTAVSIIFIMIALWVFHGFLRRLYNLVYFRQNKRAWLFFFASIGMAVIMAALVGEFVGNYYLGGALLGGWVIVFLMSIYGGEFKQIQSAENAND